MNIIKITFEECTKEKQELLIAFLSEMTAVEGFEELENSIIAFINEDNFNNCDIENLPIENLKYSKEIIAPQNWNAIWESNFEPIIIDDFCGIRANFHQPIENVQHELIITPKMSFGTGHHATTYQVIKMMEELDFKNKSVCDYGTGTGILAILAEKLCANKVVAIDNDDWCLENSKENFSINNCLSISLIKSETLNSELFDIILANINKNVLIQSMQTFNKNLILNGKLILSGILKEDLQDLTTSLNQFSFEIEKITEKNNWLCILANKL